MIRFSRRKVVHGGLDVRNSAREAGLNAAPRILTTPSCPVSREGAQEPAEKCYGTDSRTALLEAALHCFATHGFDGTSIRDIACRAQRNSSLISHYFGSKEGLYVEVFRHLFRMRRSAFGGDPSVPYRRPRNRSEAVLLLRDLIRILFSDFCPWPENPDPMMVLGRELLLHELRKPRSTVVALLRKRAAPWFRKFGACLGVLKPELTRVQRNFLGISIMGEMMSHVLMQGVRPDEWGLEGFQSTQAVELLIEFNMRGLGISEARMEEHCCIMS